MMIEIRICFVEYECQLAVNEILCVKAFSKSIEYNKYETKKKLHCMVLALPSNNPATTKMQNNFTFSEFHSMLSFALNKPRMFIIIEWFVFWFDVFHLFLLDNNKLFVPIV